MKKIFKIVSLFALFVCLIILILLIILYVHVTLPMSRQMESGREFMNLLSQESLGGYVNWADELLNENNENDKSSFFIDIPPELKRANVQYVKVNPPNRVIISWLGGYDTTALIFDKSPETKKIIVRAFYTSEENGIIWGREGQKYQAHSK